MDKSNLWLSKGLTLSSLESKAQQAFTKPFLWCVNIGVKGPCSINFITTKYKACLPALLLLGSSPILFLQSQSFYSTFISWSVEYWACICICIFPVKEKGQTLICNYEIITVVLAQTGIRASQHDARQPAVLQDWHLTYNMLMTILDSLTFTKHQPSSSGSLYSSFSKLSWFAVTPGKVAYDRTR